MILNILNDIMLNMISFLSFYEGLSVHVTLQSRKYCLQPRPTPTLTLKTRYKGFQQSSCEKKDRLCATVEKQLLFYSLYLLLRLKSSTLTQIDYVNMHHLLGDCQKHEISKSHIKAYITGGINNLCCHQLYWNFMFVLAIAPPVVLSSYATVRYSLGK